MAHERSGPGLVVKNPRAPLGGVRATLTNFDVDSDVLKPEHQAFLDAAVIPVLTRQRSRIWLQGQASHTGSKAHNLELSHRRAHQTMAYLKTRGAAESQMQVDWVGESLAGANRHEQAGQRAVSLLAAPLGSLTLPPPVPPVAPTTIPTNTNFRIRLLGALSGGAAVVQLERLFFQLWDFEHRITCFYLYESSGLGQGVGASMSATLSGHWNRFSTTAPLDVTQFAGAARFTTAGAGPWTWNYLNMMGLPAGVSTSPNPLALDTGFTVGFGVRTGVGRMLPGFMGPFSG